jgi:hypothetical protein
MRDMTENTVVHEIVRRRRFITVVTFVLIFPVLGLLELMRRCVFDVPIVWAILASAVFVVILCIGLASAKDIRPAELTLTAFAVSALLSTAGLGVAPTCGLLLDRESGLPDVQAPGFLACVVVRGRTVWAASERMRGLLRFTALRDNPAAERTP